MKQYFLTQALAKVRFGNPYSGLAFAPEFHHGWDQWGYGGVRAGVPGLATDLTKLLRQQMAAGSLSEPIFGLWLHCVDPKTPEAKALFEELVKSAAYGKMNPAYHNMAAHRLLFGEAALKPLPTDPRVVSRELLALSAGAQPATVEAALKVAMTRVAQAPEPVAVYGLQKVAALPTFAGETRSFCLSLFTTYSPLGPYPSGQGYGSLASSLLREMQKEKDWGNASLYVSAFWRAIEADDADRSLFSMADGMVAFAEEALQAGAPSVAVAVARMGLNGKLSCLDPADTRTGGQQRVGRLRQVAGKAGTAMGVVEIPVDEKHAAYPLYKSNAEFVKDNLDSAW